MNALAGYGSSDSDESKPENPLLPALGEYQEDETTSNDKRKQQVEEKSIGVEESAVVEKPIGAEQIAMLASAMGFDDQLAATLARGILEDESARQQSIPCKEHIVKNINNYWRNKHQGIDFVEEQLKGKREFGNPSMLKQLIVHLDINEYGTEFPTLDFPAE